MVTVLSSELNITWVVVSWVCKTLLNQWDKFGSKLFFTLCAKLLVIV